MAQHMEISTDLLNWLLEPRSPTVRYLTMRDLLEHPSNDPELNTAHQEAHEQGAIATIIEAMDQRGYWFKPGAGYSPKYKSTVWTIIMLAQLGASVKHEPRIGVACNHLLDHALTEDGQFGTQGTPSTNIDCLQGNLCSAMLDLSIEDSRLTNAFDWMARSVTGEGVAARTEKQAKLRFYENNSGPRFLCGWNNHMACAWGAIKVLLAFSKLPSQQRTPRIQRAIEIGVDFLFSRDPALADYPTGNDGKPSRKWWKLGFPVFYVSDLLQNIEALTALGYCKDPRLSNALDIIRNKRDEDGRWALENTYNTWVDFGELKQPNKWVTLRALRVLRAVA